VLWPYGYTYTDVPADMTQDDHDTFVTMGQAMAAMNGYTPQQSSDLYITDGTIDDWLYAVIPTQTTRNRTAVSTCSSTQPARMK